MTCAALETVWTPLNYLLYLPLRDLVIMVTYNLERLQCVAIDTNIFKVILMICRATS